jgi:hypothetical protein
MKLCRKKQKEIVTVQGIEPETKEGTKDELGNQRRNEENKGIGQLI